MNHIALKQAIQFIPIMYLGGDESKEPRKEADRVIDSVEVYHISNCDFNLGSLDEDRAHFKAHPVGKLQHPHLMIGMPSIGGTVRLEVDTRFEGWYLLWAGVKMNEWAIGPSERCWGIVCWTPKVKGDNIEKAGRRLMKNMMLNIDGVGKDEWTTNLYKGENWEKEWDATEPLMSFMREIRTPQ